VFACLTCISQSRRLKISSAIHAEDIADGGPECAAKIERLASLNNQVLGKAVGRDPFFPPSLTSIAPKGTTCGDSAQQISKSCDKFNQWSTFQRVARNMGKSFKVMQGSRVKFSDIDQGQLGNCYFLAALAAVAITHPEVIQDMFVDRELWWENEFRTKWLINGRLQTLVVDNAVPANWRGTFFTQPGPNGEFWPVILAKTWAKIFGSFKAAEGGIASEVIRAMTRAPADYIDIDDGNETEDSTWQSLLGGIRNKYPMVAGTCSNCGDPERYGLARSHAYTVLDAYTLRGSGRVVKMFNPWANHNFRGVLRQTTQLNGVETGVFTMTLNEFFVGFSDVSITYVTAGYKATYEIIPAGDLYAAQVSVFSPGKFWVTLVWPSQRLVAPCPYLYPDASVQLELSTGGGRMEKQLKRWRNDPELAFEIENGPKGIYNLLAKVDFKDNSTWMSEVSLSVYGPGVVGIKQHTTEPKLLALQMLGAECNVAALPREGWFTLDTATTINGIPTYWSPDRSSFAFYVDSKDEWWVTGQEKWGDVEQGNLWSRNKYAKEDFTCVESKRRASNLKDLAIEILGPDCKVATLPEIGVFTADTETTIRGIPTYWNLDRSEFAYYVAKEDVWYVTSPAKIGEIRRGTNWFNHKFSKNDFRCGCHDADGGVGGFGEHIPCARATNRNYKYRNVKCSGATQSAHVQKYCPATCGTCPEIIENTNDEVELEPRPRPPRATTTTTTSPPRATTTTTIGRPRATTITTTTLADLSSETVGPGCAIATLPSVGLVSVDMANTISGIQTYWNLDRSSFAYYVETYDVWYVSSRDKWGEVQQGRLWSTHKFSKKDFTCVESKRRASDLKDLAIEILGPDCQVASLPRVGWVTADKATTIDGIPTYWSLDKKDFAYFHDDLWYATSRDKMGQVRQGETWSWGKFSKKDFTCVESKKNNTNVKDLAIEVLGPDCKVATLPQVGLVTVNTRTTIRGIPTYWTLDRKNFAYHHDNMWNVISRDKMREVEQGTLWNKHKFSKNDFRCGCHDADGGVGGFRNPVPCARVTNRNYMYNNVKCFGATQSAHVQTFCPVTCNKCPSSTL
jgi:hypothetical protein